MSSKIPEIQDLRNLPKVLEQYQVDLKEAEEHLAIKGKKLEHANRENPAWQIYYDQRRIELRTLVDYLEAQVKRIRGKLYRSFVEQHSRELNDRAIEKYIDNEKAYLDKYEIYLEVKEIYNKYQAVVDAFTARGYALNNITKVRVGSLEDVII